MRFVRFVCFCFGLLLGWCSVCEGKVACLSVCLFFCFGLCCWVYFVFWLLGLFVCWRGGLFVWFVCLFLVCFWFVCLCVGGEMCLFVFVLFCWGCLFVFDLFVLLVCFWFVE